MRQQVAPMQLDRDQRAVLNLLNRQHEPVPAARICHRLQMSHERTYSALVHLEARSLARIVVQRVPAEAKAWESIQ